VLIVLSVKPCVGEQKENGEQLLQSFFCSLLEVCSMWRPSSHLSKMEQGAIALNKM
jgi:hypothetical protein